MDHQVKYLLDESELPRQWYNVHPRPAVAPAPAAAPGHPRSRSAPTTWPRCSRWR